MPVETQPEPDQITLSNMFKLLFTETEFTLFAENTNAYAAIKGAV